MLLSPSPSNTCYLPGPGSVHFYASAASLFATSFTRFGTHSSIIFRGLKRKKITRASKTVFRYIQPVIMPFSANSKESRNSILRLLGQSNLCADKEIRFLIFLLQKFSGAVCNKQDFAAQECFLES